jgi:hypothetical protein
MRRRRGGICPLWPTEAVALFQKPPLATAANPGLGTVLEACRLGTSGHDDAKFCIVSRGISVLAFREEIQGWCSKMSIMRRFTVGHLEMRWHDWGTEQRPSALGTIIWLSSTTPVLAVSREGLWENEYFYSLQNRSMQRHQRRMRFADTRNDQQ